MKKIKLILFAFTLALVASCDDAIDIKQKGELLPEDTYKTVGDLKLGLSGVYAAVPAENAILFTSLFTDEVAIGKSNGGQGKSGELAFLLNSGSDDAASIWASNYAVVNRANRLLKGADEVVAIGVEDEELDQINNIRAEVRTLRAYAYLQLLSYFSEDMKNDDALGVILFDFVPTVDELYLQLPRSKNAAIFELINSDLAYAEMNLDPASGNTYKFVTPDLIKAIKVRMAGYRGHYNDPEMLTLANELIATYELSTGSTYQDMFKDTQQGEIIFGLERTRAGRSVGNFAQFWASVNSTITGSPFFEVNRALFNLVDDEDDIRRKIVMDASGTPSGNYEIDPEYLKNDVLPVGKYTSSESMNLLNDIKVFRVSEIYFLKAEIFASQGNFAGVASVLQDVVDARFNTVPPTIAVPANAQQAWAEILKQRRAELAFEGHRYLDLRRLGVLAGVGVQRDPRDCEFNGYCTLPADDHRFILPIPQIELTANAVIRQQQNPGY